MRKWLRTPLTPFSRVLIIVAALLMLPALDQPLWTVKLTAPQYPEGLIMTIYSTTVEGNLDSINTLNHYVGMHEVHPDEFKEFKLVPYAILWLSTLALLGALWGRRWLAVLGYATFILFGAVMLGDMAHWLYQYGHDLKPNAPIRLKPFMPPIIGTQTIANFTVSSWPAAGVWWMLVAAGLGPLVLTLNIRGVALPRLPRRAVLLLFCLALTAVSHGQPLQPLVDAAAPGSTLHLPAGTYSGPVRIEKPLAVTGTANTVVDGGGTGTVLTVRADDVTLDTLHLTGTGNRSTTQDAAVLVKGSRRFTLLNLQIDTRYDGILLQKAHHGRIESCRIRGPGQAVPEGQRGDGIRLWNSHDNTISDNTIELTRDGVYFSYADRNRVQRNQARRLRYGLHYMSSNNNRFYHNLFSDNAAGAAIMYSQGLVVKDNQFVRNRGYRAYGLLLKQCDNTRFESNRLHGNTIGLHMDESNRNTFTENVIAANDVGLNLFASSEANRFHGNALIENLEQVRLAPGTYRNTFEGNYWSDALAFDLDGDGRADRAHHAGSAFGTLEAAYPPLRSLLHSPASLALEMAARRFPVVPLPTIVDASPRLQAPERVAPVTAGPTSAFLPGLLVLLLSWRICSWVLRSRSSASRT